MYTYHSCVIHKRLTDPGSTGGRERGPGLLGQSSSPVVEVTDPVSLFPYTGHYGDPRPRDPGDDGRSRSVQVKVYSWGRSPVHWWGIGLLLRSSLVPVSSTVQSMRVPYSQRVSRPRVVGSDCDGYPPPLPGSQRMGVPVRRTETRTDGREGGSEVLSSK